jgi:RimJ/RimL family protein N-acetyltransferase
MGDDGSLRLRDWSLDDLPLLERINAPEMMTHLGGPETPEKVRQRNARYAGLRATTHNRMHVIEVDGAPAGSIGLWESEWAGEPMWETGWSVLPEFQGRGIATGAVGMIVDEARADGRYRLLMACPSVGNAASNGVCRKAGFHLDGEVDLEYPPGHPMRANLWLLDLRGAGDDGVRSATA